MDVYGLSLFQKHYSKQNVKPNAKTSKYSPGLLLKHTFPKLFESLFQVPLRKTERERKTHHCFANMQDLYSFVVSSYALERKRNVARDLQLDEFPQEMLTASEKGECATATGATMSQWVPRGTAIASASAAECLTYSLLHPWKYFLRTSVVDGTWPRH